MPADQTTTPIIIMRRTLLLPPPSPPREEGSDGARLLVRALAQSVLAGRIDRARAQLQRAKEEEEEEARHVHRALCALVDELVRVLAARYARLAPPSSSSSSSCVSAVVVHHPFQSAKACGEPLRLARAALGAGRASPDAFAYLHALDDARAYHALLLATVHEGGLDLAAVSPEALATSVVLDLHAHRLDSFAEAGGRLPPGLLAGGALFCRWTGYNTPRVLRMLRAMVERCGVDPSERAAESDPGFVDHGETPLHGLSRLNVAQDPEPLVRELLALGANPLARDALGRTPAEAWFVRRARFGDASRGYERLVDAAARVGMRAALPALVRALPIPELRHLVFAHLRERAPLSRAQVHRSLHAEGLRDDDDDEDVDAVVAGRACFLLPRFRAAHLLRSMQPQRRASGLWRLWLMLIALDRPLDVRTREAAARVLYGLAATPSG